MFAAASLKDAFRELGSAYEASHPGVRVVFSFDASNTLRVQIEQGAPADVLASADTENPAGLAAEGMTAGQPTVFAANRLAIIVPHSNPAGIRTPADLARPGLKLIAAGDGVPITTYTDELLDQLSRLPGYPAGFAAAVRANFVSREDNVRAIVTKIELGEGDAGIVYATDARAASDLESIPVPDAVDVNALYAAVALKSPDQSGPAAAFVAFLTTRQAQAILSTFAFLPPQ